MSLLPASIKRVGLKTTEKRWRNRFPQYKSMGVFCCHGNQSFDPICPKILCSLSPTPVMLHIKFGQVWPTGFRDIQVWKCGQWTDDKPLVYYKLTLWAFGSGELIIATLLDAAAAKPRPSTALMVTCVNNIIWRRKKRRCQWTNDKGIAKTSEFPNKGQMRPISMQERKWKWPTTLSIVASCSRQIHQYNIIFQI